MFSEQHHYRYSNTQEVGRIHLSAEGVCLYNGNGELICRECKTNFVGMFLRHVIAVLT